MDEDLFNDFFTEKWKRIIYVVKAHLFYDLYFVYIA
jgi:hypothetical protein